MMTLLRPLAALATVAALAVTTGTACSPQDFLGDFVDSPYGTAGAEVQALESPELTTLMTTLYTRYTRYVELRETLPFESLLSDACVISSETTAQGTSFVISISCAFGSEASGEVLLSQRTISTNPRVTEIDLDYRNVTVGEFVVDGTESIRETDGAEGTSQRTLDMVQGGIELNYEFRLGLLNGQQVVLDYVMKSAGGEDILARLTDPQTPGAAATVFLTGIDGQLSCELRNIPWSADEPARGLCDNGQTFGLPEETPTVAP